MPADLTSFIVMQLNSIGLQVFGIDSAAPNVKTYCFRGHDQKTPSLSIRRIDGKFLCFGCGISGHNWNALAGHLKLAPLDEQDLPDPFALMHADLDMKMKKALSRVELPWDVEPWVRPWRGLPVGLLKAAHALRWYDDWSLCERVLLPVEMYGKVEGWVARRTDAAPPGEKLDTPYRNAPRMEAKDVLFPFDLVTKVMAEDRKRTIVLVEGPYDALRLLKYRIPALSILGTRQYRPDNRIHLMNAGAKRIIVAMDGDTAGDEARVEIAMSLKEFQDFEAVLHFQCPREKETKDPGSMPLSYVRRLEGMI